MDIDKLSNRELHAALVESAKRDARKPGRDVERFITALAPVFPKAEQLEGATEAWWLRLSQIVGKNKPTPVERRRIIGYFRLNSN